MINLHQFANHLLKVGRSTRNQSNHHLLTNMVLFSNLNNLIFLFIPFLSALVSTSVVFACLTCLTCPTSAYSNFLCVTSCFYFLFNFYLYSSLHLRQALTLSFTLVQFNASILLSIKLLFIILVFLLQLRQLVFQSLM